MKKLILLLSLVIITACSSSSDDDSGKANTTGDSFNPPAWIIGTWKDTGATTYNFTNDDIICTVSGSRLSFKDQAKSLKDAKITYSIKETKTDNSYVAEFKFSAGTTIFSFTKTADNKMTSDGYLSGNYTKQ
ncbi:hypothetical protein [Flavobacterium sp. LC2016-01]|uniref:hypothetical protein n=1 Tax=Flavobacterium sp. LC2016-01 TaxID=2675876 RepID=UPI0012BA7AA1|nr:hypothetical protein [Flavobacterium sp. LC2016-01]MTH16992.1 hypothetical protein [Flavobacterium sp. LC2016-01]